MGRRVPAWLLPLLIVALLAAGLAAVLVLDGGGGNEPPVRPALSVPGDSSGSAGAPTVPPAQKKIFDELMAQVAGVRGLQWKDPLNLQVLSKDALGRKVREVIARDADPNRIAVEEATLKVLGLIPASLDYPKLMQDLFAEQVLGFYDPERRELYVGSEGEGEPDAFTRYVIAHEMTHALTDQVFEYGPATIALDKADKSEESSAYSAMLEGDAVLTQELWADKYLSPVERLSVALGSGGSTGVLDKTPAYIQRALYFPYGDGRAFVKRLYDAGGFTAVDAAYRRPPTTTEQILHPETYDAKQGALAPALPNLAAVTGCTALRSGIVGQFDMRAILDTHLSEADAGRAVEGWNGDTYGLVRCGNSLGLADRWETDPGTDPARLVDALSRWAGQWAGGRAPGADGRFSGPNGAGRILRSGTHVDLVLGQDADTAAKLVSALGSS